MMIRHVKPQGPLSCRGPSDRTHLNQLSTSQCFIKVSCNEKRLIQEAIEYSVRFGDFSEIRFGSVEKLAEQPSFSGKKWPKIEPFQPKFLKYFTKIEWI